MPTYHCFSILPPWVIPERNMPPYPGAYRVVPSVPKSTKDNPCDVPGCFVCAQATEQK